MIDFWRNNLDRTWPVKVRLKIDWKAPGLDPAKARLLILEERT